MSENAAATEPATDMAALSAGPSDYTQWRAEALERDRHSGAARWKATDRSSLFDYRVIRRRLDELVEIKASGDVRRLLYYLNEGMHGNMGGMGSAGLYRHAAFGTKHLVSDYIGELAGALELLAAADNADLSRPEKLKFFRRTRQAYGNCALMLSGAGSLGPFHLGVARALTEQRLLPTVVSGASAGGVVAAAVCTHDDERLAQLLQEDLTANLANLGAADGTRRQRIDLEHLRHIIETWIPDMTFAEALEASGRDLSISVAPAEMQQQPRTLNAVTSPNVLIREAVMATCAIPGIFPAVTLAARGVDGRRMPFVRSRKWVDGSVTDDMPVGRLSRVYGCNFFIASQANPIVRWAIQDPHSSDPMARLASIYTSSWKQWMRFTYPMAIQTVREVYPLNVITRMLYSISTQDYTADVTIMPQRRFHDPLELLSRLSAAESAELVREGEEQTWPVIERIRNSTLVGRTIARLLRELEAAVPLRGIRARGQTVAT